MNGKKSLKIPGCHCLTKRHCTSPYVCSELRDAGDTCFSFLIFTDNSEFLKLILCIRCAENLISIQFSIPSLLYPSHQNFETIKNILSLELFLTMLTSWFHCSHFHARGCLTLWWSTFTLNILAQLKIK